jgi:methylenetetrahydrofolate reductase (NADPH)
MRKIGFSLEVFPPKTNVDVNEIYKSFDAFSVLKPDFISVTYGAGGSTQKMTKEISRDIQNVYKIPSVAHLTCVGATKTNISEILREFNDEGITRILAMRGDLPDGSRESLGDFQFATDLIEYINKTQNGKFDVFAACYPEGHCESSSLYQDLDIAKKKADLGVKTFISQLFFENDDFFNMRDAFAKRGINVPIQAGIMPLTNIRQILRIVTMCGAKLPKSLTKIIARFENNPAALYQAGLNYAAEQITHLLAEEVDGVHIYTMNNPKIAQSIHTAVLPVLEEVNK